MQLLYSARFFNTSQRQVWSEFARFTHYAQRLQPRFDLRGNFREIRRRINADPEDARASLVWEETRPAENHLDRRVGSNATQYIFNSLHTIVSHFADKFQRHVNPFAAHPSR
jgi:hypothetical protein